MRDETSETGIFSPLERLEGPPDGGVLLLCDHASAALPAEFGDLGLSADHFTRHIAYDIGAAELTRQLARRMGAPALLTTYSRLLIDPNRGADDPTLVMRISDRAQIPGNARVSAQEIERRRQLYWQPYRDAIGAHVAQMTAAGPPPVLVSLHSFTPVWRGHPRPWHAGVLWDCDDRLARPVIAALRARPGLIVGDNEPYDGALRGDTMFDHGTVPGLAHILIEVRQDLIATPAGAAEWAALLSQVLAHVLAAGPGSDDLRAIRHYPSRAASPAQLARLREQTR